MSQRVLVDINILLDVLARREPHYAASAALWAAAETRAIEGLVSATSIVTLYYLLHRAANRATALRGIRLVRELFHVIPVDEVLIDEAMVSPLHDFEGAVQYHSALRAGVAIIVTRDMRHFKNSAIPVLSPAAILAHLGG
ncbi:MAG: type II toxin-antitoxin system VapC family toxin [Phycisphaerae bacterium]